jgi:hypothetical protein
VPFDEAGLKTRGYSVPFAEAGLKIGGSVTP